MTDYYFLTQLMTDIDTTILNKKKELELLQTFTDIGTKIKINQLEYEINELNTQRTYYDNKILDQLMNNCASQCSNGCCKYCKSCFK